MDSKTVAELLERIEWEGTREGPPADFPKLPDIPLGRYTDPDLYRAEIDEIFKRGWLFAGHVGDYPAAGSYRVLDLPFAPVIVARGNDGELRGFLNACRHRGAPVVRDVEGTARLFVCQFHSWSYDLDGNLTRVPEERDFVGLDRDERGLTRVRVETWGELVFVNLDHDAPTLAEWLGPLTQTFGDLAGAPLRLVHRWSCEVACNWKVVVEAFLETYHVKTIHPEGAIAVDPRFTATVLYPNGHSFLAVQYSDTVKQAEFATLMWPEDLPRLPELEAYGGMQSGFFTFPNIQVLGDVSASPVFSFWPTGIDSTRFDVDLYGADWGDDPRPESWDFKIFQLGTLIEQDKANLEPIQQSIEAAAHAGVPLGFMERALWHFHANIDRLLGDSVPAHLRIPDLLAHLVEGEDR